MKTTNNVNPSNASSNQNEADTEKTIAYFKCMTEVTKQDSQGNDVEFKYGNYYLCSLESGQIYPLLTYETGLYFFDNQFTMAVPAFGFKLVKSKVYCVGVCNGSMWSISITRGLNMIGYDYVTFRNAILNLEEIVAAELPELLEHKVSEILINGIRISAKNDSFALPIKDT